jgi:hypothetical protein
MMLPRLRHDGPPRSLADIELPLMALVAVLVGLGIALLLNSLGGVTSGPVEIRTVTDRPAIDSPRAQLSAAATAERAHDRQVALKRHRRAANRRAAALKLAAAKARFRATPTTRTTDSQTYTQQTYTQQSLPSQPAPSPSPAPKPSPKPASGGGGGGGSPFDDSG